MNDESRLSRLLFAVTCLAAATTAFAVAWTRSPQRLPVATTPPAPAPSPIARARPAPAEPLARDRPASSTAALLGSPIEIPALGDLEREALGSRRASYLRSMLIAHASRTLTAKPSCLPTTKQAPSTLVVEIEVRSMRERATIEGVLDLRVREGAPVDERVQTCIVRRLTAGTTISSDEGREFPEAFMGTAILPVSLGSCSFLPE